MRRSPEQRSLLSRPGARPSSRPQRRESARLLPVSPSVYVSGALAALTMLAVESARAADVTIRGRKREAGGTTLTRDEVREIPGAFGDPGRAIEALPGVIAVGTLLPFYFVRGATPSNTGYFLDGMRLPLFSHGPPGGGVVAGSAIESVEFFPGAAPSRFGGVTGGILSVTTLALADRTRAEASVRLYDSSALVETPIADGRASVLASGRYGYTQVLLNVLEPSVKQAYWDYYARATWSLSRESRLSVVAVGARDVVGSGGGETIVDSAFHRAEVRYDAATRGGGKIRVAATTGVNAQGNEVGSVTDRLLAFRVEAVEPMTKELQLVAGASAAYERYDVVASARARAIDPEILFAPRRDLSNAAYTELAWRISAAVQIDAGVRLGMFSTKRDAYPTTYRVGFDDVGPASLSTPSGALPPPPGAASKVGVDPRMSACVRLDRRITLVSAFGLAHGPPSFLLPGLAMSRLEDGLQTAIQASTGFELTLPGDLTAKVTGFLHNYLDLSDPTATCPDHTALLFNPTDPCFGRRVRGRAFGGELLVRRSLTKRLAGWLSYTLSRSTREAHAPGWVIIGASREALVDVLSEWDRTHVVSVMGAYDLGRGWRAAARVSYATGRPYSHTIRGVLIGPYNRDRLPDVHRIDLRLEKRWALDHERTVSLILEGFNATVAREPTECRPSGLIQSAPVPAAYLRGGRVDDCVIERSAAVAVPSIGLEGTF